MVRRQPAPAEEDRHTGEHEQSAAAAPPTRRAIPPARFGQALLRAIDEALRAGGDTSRVRQADTASASLYRAATGIRPSTQIPAATERNVTGPVSVAQLLDSASLALPDPATFKEYEYKSGLQAEYIARPSIGYSPDNFGRSVFGGTTLVFSDLLGNNRLAVSAAINGRLSEGYFFAGYTNLARRNQYSFGAAQEPFHPHRLPGSTGRQRNVQHLRRSV